MIMKKNHINQLKKSLVEASRYFFKQGWSLATSSNYSARISKKQILITQSGKDKGQLKKSDLMFVDYEGRALKPRKARASAETLLHCDLYKRYENAGAVLHIHSKAATVLSMKTKGPELVIQGYEMLKALSGVSTHEHREVIPIVENKQNMHDIIEALQGKLGDTTHAYLIRGHGFYTWGETVAKTRHQIEALEFLFQCLLAQ